MGCAGACLGGGVLPNFAKFLGEEGRAVTPPWSRFISQRRLTEQTADLTGATLTLHMANREGPWPQPPQRRCRTNAAGTGRLAVFAIVRIKSRHQGLWSRPAGGARCA